MRWEWVILPVLGSIIGWVTNFIAIRMLFRPKRQLKIGGMISFQGVLPRRKEALARVVAETVERDLLPMDELLKTVDVSKYESEVVEAVIGYVDRRIESNLPELLPLPFRRLVGEYVKRVAAKEARRMVTGIIDRVKKRVREDVRLGDLVLQKMKSFDTDDLERIVVRVAGTELRAIEALGALLGFVIGTFQALLVTGL